MSITDNESVQPEFDPRTETYQVRHDSDNAWRLSTTLVLSLSSLTGDDPVQMFPLHRAVDPDVLNSHVSDRDRGSRLSFEFHGHDVTVRDDGQIAFVPLDEREA